MPEEVRVPVTTPLRGVTWRALEKKATAYGTSVGSLLALLADTYAGTRDSEERVLLKPFQMSGRDTKDRMQPNSARTAPSSRFKWMLRPGHSPERCQSPTVAECLRLIRDGMPPADAIRQSGASRNAIYHHIQKVE